MATTTSAKAARKAARESALEANAELARRTKLNVADLRTFFASMGRPDGVEEWLNEKIAALKEQAAKRRDGERRDGERRDAGMALTAMRAAVSKSATSRDWPASAKSSSRPDPTC
jgi:hypothetical protein